MKQIAISIAIAATLASAPAAWGAETVHRIHGVHFDGPLHHADRAKRDARLAQQPERDRKTQKTETGKKTEEKQ